MRALAWLGSALALAGCARPELLPSTERVRVEALSLTYLGEGEARLDAALSVHNAGSAPSQLAEVHWELWLDGRWFAAGARALGVTAPPASWTEVEWSAPLSFRADAEAEANGKRRVRVGLRGSVRASTGGFEERLRFHHLELRTLERAPR